MRTTMKQMMTKSEEIGIIDDQGSGGVIALKNHVVL